MTVLVTGGSGVLGLHVVRAMAAHGEFVVAYSTSGAPPGADVVLGDFASRVEFVQGDIRDLDRLRETAGRNKVRGIIHSAALTGEAQARARPHDVFAVNVAGTANVLEVARLAKMRRVVYIGSASEYGRRTDLLPIGEDEINVEGLYAESKFLGHRLGQRYREVYGLDVITVRVSSAYGPGTRFNAFRKLVGNTLIAHLCRSVAMGESVVLEGGGDYPRGWTYASDTAAGVRLAYQTESLRHSVYNVASGEIYTVAKVVEAVRRIEPRAKIEISPGQWDDDPFQAGNLRGPLDITRAREDLEFRPAYDLEAGLREYIAWWRRVGPGGAVDSARRDSTGAVRQTPVGA